ncbi:hypothetical protein BH11ARM2_BH11ARM2_11610 [soil metagenome]
MLPIGSLISAMFLWPVPVPLVGMGSSLVVDWPGSGPAHEVEYIAWDGLGRESANSTKRGLPFTLPATGDALLEGATLGLTSGGMRFVWTFAEALPPDLGGIFPPHTDAILWLVGK